ncbi:hypothetical protein BASA61_009286 [Batrachochytrium salamandrivorans]|nr:hypothetical protein BASA60_011520 [Batrachochytrium salamandrivorans]KAH6576980.1 hypothetical protein BASA62_001090 [Batrachochytrium salamandrivorans]KAH6581025.1 hypothetical protein BASA61_009286 [Batrachochytrium salamandrivorans]KAJ1344035.1 hypothetical protein BSLG_001175 [Batrachochytrium salamandrivorans]
MAAPILHTSPVTANATATDTNPTTTAISSSLPSSVEVTMATMSPSIITTPAASSSMSASLTPLGRPNRTRIAGAVRTLGYPELKTDNNSGIDLLPVAATIGKYRILRELGVGSFSFVRLALDVSSVPSSATSMNVTTAGSMNASASSSVDIHNTSCIEDIADAGSLPPTADTYNTDRVPIQYPLSHMPRKVALKCVDRTDESKTKLLRQEAAILHSLHGFGLELSEASLPSDLSELSPLLEPSHSSRQPELVDKPDALHSPIRAGAGAYDQLTAAQRDRLRNGQTHIVRSGELLENDRVLCLVLEYCPGVELFDHILDRHVVLSSGATGIPESEAKKIFRSLLEAVYFLHHHNIAHCDLKLENILVTESTPPIVKLIDFGLSLHYDPASKAAFARGSEPYISPELVLRQSINPLKADVWALGVILYAMLTLRMPFSADPPPLRGLSTLSSGGDSITSGMLATPQTPITPNPGMMSLSPAPSLVLPTLETPMRPNSFTLQSGLSYGTVASTATPNNQMQPMSPSNDTSTLRSRPSLSNGNPSTRRMFHRIAVGTYSYTPEETQYLSADAMNLVSRLLTRDATRRPYVWELFDHAWFSDMDTDGDAVAQTTNNTHDGNGVHPSAPLSDTRLGMGEGLNGVFPALSLSTARYAV